MSTNFAPQGAREWRILSDADLAMLRYSLMHELARFDREQRPSWEWRQQHQALLAVKAATALEQEVVT